MKDKLKDIKLIIFDWDGVFNNGYKIDGKSSNFSAVDSMGVNMLRYSFWLKNGEIPKVAIMSGDKNEMAKEFAEEQNIENVIINCKNKLVGLDNLLQEYQGAIKPENVAFFFDDILDLKLAEYVKLRIMISNPALKHLKDFAIKRNLYDYYTENTGDKNAVREACDNLIKINNNYDEVVTTRMEFSEKYAEYWKIRGKIVTSYIKM